MENPPSLAALKLFHVLIAIAGPRMADDVEHSISLSDVRRIEGMRHHDRASLKQLFSELSSAVLVTDKSDGGWRVSGLLDEADAKVQDEDAGDLVIVWTFRRAFIRMVEASDHWAILDREVALRFKSRYAMLLFLHISSLTRLTHISSKTFPIEDLRAVLGVEDGALQQFKNLNTWALKPAIDEINGTDLITLTATLKKRGRTVTAVEIAWQTKASPTRQLPRLVATGTPTGIPSAGPGPRLAFPDHGGISYKEHWKGIKKAAGCNKDDQIIASDFRRFCAEKGISLAAANIETVFKDFCKKVGRV